jgi:hypothetical protein
LNPNFNDKFSFPASDVKGILEVDVFDENTLANRLIGRVIIPLKDIASLSHVLDTDGGVKGRNSEQKYPDPKWFELDDADGNKGSKSLGSILLELRWRSNPCLPPFELTEADDADDNDEVDDEDAIDAYVPTKAEISLFNTTRIETKSKEKEMNDILSKEQATYKIISGDYQVHVHVIECRNLKAKNFNGTSDSVVTVEMFSQKQNTAIISGTLSPVFDDLLIFNMNGLDKDEFEASLIKVIVNDSGSLSDSQIGSYTFDSTFVYYQKDHEIYNSWVALINEADKGDEGIQGYLKLSVQVVGPQDRLKVHRPEVESSSSKGTEDITSMVLITPTIKKEKRWYVLTTYCGDYLPMMDRAIGAGGITLMQGGIDAVYSVEFSNSKVSFLVHILYLTNFQLSQCDIS